MQSATLSQTLGRRHLNLLRLLLHPVPLRMLLPPQAMNRKHRQNLLLQSK
jgi:hypothetical protein